MDYRKLVLIFFTALLVGCKQGIQPRIESQKNIKKITNQFFSLQIPPQISKIIHRPDKSDAYLTFDNTIMRRMPNDFSIEVYPPESFNSSPCSPSTLGVSAPLTLTGANGNAVWGRVDFWDTLIGEADPRPIPKCIPPFPHDSRSYFPCTDSGDIMSIPLKDLCASRQRQYEIDHGMYAAYTLCSQKEEKAVLICISQVQDNPTLAQKIFETFRWKE